MAHTPPDRPRLRPAFLATLSGLAIAVLVVWALLRGANDGDDERGLATEGAAARVESTLARVEAPEPITGFVVVESSPPGAAIHLSGSNTGHVTPHTFSTLSLDRPHDFSLRLHGYLTASYPDVRVVEGDTLWISHRFTALLSPLAISSRPPNALVVVDGREVGRTPVSVESLATGPHEVQIRKDGYKPWSGTVQIPARGDRLGVVLRPREADADP